jgi:PAS domain S-box-containing protein
MSRPLRVVLLEDNQDDAVLILRVLRLSGFSPTGERVDTEPAFRAQLALEPELILADFLQPDFDALRALRLVQECGKDIPVIVVTGALGDEAAVQCLKAGAADYLLKDRLARLGQAVTHALDQKQARADRRRAVQALRDSEARKTAILEAAGDAIITIDEQDIIESVNPAFERLFGYTAQEIIGQNIQTLIPSSGPDQNQRELGRLFMGDSRKTPGISWEAVGRKKDGTAFPIERTLNEVQLVDCRLFTGTVRDISERKIAELKLVRRTNELAQSNVELEQFAYIASHDLQEPLRTIGSFAQLLARRYAGKLDASANDFISYITDGVTRMQTLINDLLEYSRLGTGGASFQLTNFETVVELVIANLKTSLVETGAVVTYESLPTLWAASSQMGRLFQNLISNAIRYRGDAAPRIHLKAHREGQHWIFSIRDNGIGFDHKHAERVFVIFQRLHTRDKYAGTGMGLAVCKKIVEGHSGRIWAESEPGRGSCFFFTIPAGESLKP